LAQQAKFLFDPRARTVVADNDQGRWLSGELDEHPARAPFKPRIASPLPVPVQETRTPELDLDEVDEDSDDEAIAPSALVRRPDPTMNRRPPDVVARRPDAVPTPSAPPRPASVVTPPAPTPSMMPPLPAAAPPAPAAAQAPAPVADPAPRRVVVDTPTLPMEAPAPLEPEQAVPARRTGTHDASADEVRPTGATPSRSSSKRRARVPSWDDILIGTRPKD
jgi:hypothetical protein